MDERTLLLLSWHSICEDENLFYYYYSDEAPVSY